MKQQKLRIRKQARKSILSLVSVLVLILICVGFHTICVYPYHWWTFGMILLFVRALLMDARQALMSLHNC